MALASQYSEVYLAGDGVTTTFAFNFEAISANYVKCIVYFENGVGVIPTYSVASSLNSITIVSLTTPEGEVLQVPPVGSQVRIFRDIPEEQNVTEQALKVGTAKQLEKALDNVVGMIQENKYDLDHKSVRTTETMRDVSLDNLEKATDGAMLYWQEDGHKIKATEYSQDKPTLSDSINGFEYDEVSDRIEFTLKDGGDPKPLGEGIIHNDLKGRNANDCHPKSAITGLVQDLQDLADADTRIEAKADEALATANSADEKADQAIETADTAIATAREADSRSQQALTNSQQAIVTSEDAKQKAIDAVDTAEEAERTANEAITTAQSADTKSDSAVATANAANTKSDSAISTANAAETKADSAVQTAGQAKTIAEGIEAKADQAISTANAASTTATNAYNKAVAVEQTVGGFDARITQAEEDASEALQKATDAETAVASKSTVSVSATGTATDEVQYITIDGVEKKLAGGSGGTSDFDELTNRPSYNGTVMTHTTDIPEVKTATWDGKQDAITDLEEIRAGAEAGSTAVQPNELGALAVKDSVNYETEVTNKPTIPTVPTNVSEFTNDANYQTGTQVSSAISEHNSSSSAHSDIRSEVASKSTVSVSATGTATDEVGYITIDGVQKKIAGGGSGGGSGRNAGDIFYTSRTDTTLAGAVECNGATYSTTDFSGEGAIGALLTAGKVPYISLSQYASDLAAHGSVRAFGWDGGSSTSFRVPTLSNVFIEAGQAASAGEYISAGLPNIIGNTSHILMDAFNLNTGVGAIRITSGGSGGNGGGSYARPSGTISIDASSSSSIYGNSTTVQPNSVKYRAMVQLANGATDEALETCTGVLTDVADLKQNKVTKGHEVIDFQEPTAANNHTWYRLYADGWVEQGGNTATKNITFPIAMANTDYFTMINSIYNNSANAPYFDLGYISTKTKTGMTKGGNAANYNWFIVGMAE